MSEPTRLGEILAEMMNNKKNQNLRGWRFDHRVNLSVLVQLAFLASLIVGSWVNLQSQLNLLQHDVTALLQSQKNIEQKLESLSAKSISYEYRLQAIEKHIPTVNIEEGCLKP